MIYKIWATILSNRLTPILNLLTSESQTAYKNSRSTLDVISLFRKTLNATTQPASYSLTSQRPSTPSAETYYVQYSTRKAFPGITYALYAWVILITNFDPSIRSISETAHAIIEAFSREAP